MRHRAHRFGSPTGGFDPIDISARALGEAPQDVNVIVHDHGLVGTQRHGHTPNLLDATADIDAIDLVIQIVSAAPSENVNRAFNGDRGHVPDGPRHLPDYP